MILALRGVVVQVFLNACLLTPSLHLSLRAGSVLTKPMLFSLRRGGGLALFLVCCVGGTWSWMQRVALRLLAAQLAFEPSPGHVLTCPTLCAPLMSTEGSAEPYGTVVRSPSLALAPARCWDGE